MGHRQESSYLGGSSGGAPHLEGRIERIWAHITASHADWRKMAARLLHLSSGISFSGDEAEEPQVVIGLPEEYPPLKFNLNKVFIMREDVRVGAPGDVVKDPVPIVLFGRLNKSSKRLDEEVGNKFVVLGTVEQLALANELLSGALPFGVGQLTHGMEVSFEDILRFDEHLNREERAFLVDHQCGSALQTPALFVDGVVFSCE